MSGINNPAAGGPAQATRSVIEAEINEDSYAPPHLLKHSPGVTKVWCQAGTTGIIFSSYNMTSVTDLAIGKITFTMTTPFSSVNYVANLSLRALDPLTPHEVGRTANSMNWDCRNSAETLEDPAAWMMSAHGDQ